MKIEQKIVLGIAFFFGILLLLGWVYLHEDARMAEFAKQFQARSIERGAAIYESNCALCHGGQGLGSGRAPALHNPHLFNGERLAEVEWPGSLYDYVASALAAGRPGSGSTWPEAMPAWGQEFGGPLRPDQVEDLIQFVLNWEKTALDEAHPPAVIQDFILPGVRGEGDLAILSSGQQVGLTVDYAALPAGDVVRGESLYQANALGCSGCHTGGVLAPPTEGTATRAAERVGTVPELAPYTVEQYLIESILQPDAYLVPDEGGRVYSVNGTSVMPQSTSSRIDAQDLADLLAYLMAQTQ